VSWRIVAASAVGTSHLTAGAPCQDDCFALSESVAGRLPTLSIFVADGAGTATSGGDGASLAVQTAAHLVGAKLAVADIQMDDPTASEFVGAIRHAIHSAADERGLKPRDYACTFLGVMSSSHGTLAMQVGDGGIVLDVGSGLEVPFVPMAGEYANMTHFVTDEDALDILMSKVYDAPALKVAAFSDGLQRLALSLSTNTPYAPFFNPFFDVLSKATRDQEDSLRCSLLTFLNSAPVNERTDDDKSLAFAVRIE
jgi:hypothetical protein